MRRRLRFGVWLSLVPKGWGGSGEGEEEENYGSQVSNSFGRQPGVRAGGIERVLPDDRPSAAPPRRRKRPNTKDMVVATRPLGVGCMIKPADVKIARCRASVSQGSFSKVEEVLDRPVISNVLLDEPILDGRLAAKGSGLGLAPTIPVGMRAVTVRVNDVAGIAGFVLPGMKVDVLVTGQPPNGDSTMTATCLQNMLVLSAGTDHEAGSARPSDQCSDRDLLVDSGTGRNADAGQQRRTNSTGAAQFERSDDREDQRPFRIGTLWLGEEAGGSGRLR